MMIFKRDIGIILVAMTFVVGGGASRPLDNVSPTMIPDTTQAGSSDITPPLNEKAVIYTVPEISETSRADGAEQVPKPIQPIQPMQLQIGGRTVYLTLDGPPTAFGRLLAGISVGRVLDLTNDELRPSSIRRNGLFCELDAHADLTDWQRKRLSAVGAHILFVELSDDVRTVLEKEMNAIPDWVVVTGTLTIEDGQFIWNRTGGEHGD